MSFVGNIAEHARRSFSAGLNRRRENRARMATLRCLETLDRSTLRDIGMSRAELNSICFGGSDRRRGHA